MEGSWKSGLLEKPLEVATERAEALVAACREVLSAVAVRANPW